MIFYNLFSCPPPFSILFSLALFRPPHLLVLQYFIPEESPSADLLSASLSSCYCVKQTVFLFLFSFLTCHQRPSWLIQKDGDSKVTRCAPLAGLNFDQTVHSFSVSK
ncbi:hypothetical protein XENOCAPTIV_028389 [Xenoophorus captivus]|uniref:Secreted protein n=1 Tax=Xenoophorus captivus TaxID=1517983 RepID=A0ABV0QNF3_9TELE